MSNIGLKLVVATSVNLYMGVVIQNKMLIEQQNNLKKMLNKKIR